MRRDFIKKVIAIVVATMSISILNPVVSYAAWNKNSQNKWNWTENGIKSVGWKMIDGKWYHFNKNGIMSTGWIKDNEKWYNLSNSGTMNTGWIKDVDGKWYNLSEDGSMNVGWISENGKWYYMNSNGAMETGKVELDGKIYIFLEDGILSNSTTLSSDKEIDDDKLTLKEKNDNKEKIENSTELRKAYVATKSSPLNIRSEASISSKIIGSLSKGTEVMVTNNEIDGFLHISSNGLDGWVSNMWISFERPNTSEENKSKKNESDDLIDESNDFTEDNKDTEDKDDIKENNDMDEIIDSSLSSIRTVAPEENSPYYYSDSNIYFKIKLSPPYSKGGNCTWYSWGRAWEITGEEPIEAGFTGNAYQWWEANKKSGKYKYGSTPKVGAIAVWKSSMPGSGGCGHVAIVEKIKNNKIYISESMWHGGIFRYSEIYNTGNLYGYIYLNEPNY